MNLMSTNKKYRKNKKAFAILGAFIAFAALTASAATLGGLTSTALGADQTVVGSCDTDGIALAYTNVYDATTNDYQTTAVTLSGVATPCIGQHYQLTLSDGAASLGEKAGTVALTAGSMVVTLTSPVVAQSVTKASLVITG
jgi:hypothetical protein